MDTERRPAELETDWPPTRNRKNGRWLGSVLVLAVLAGVALAATRSTWFPRGSLLGALGSPQAGTAVVQGSGEATITATAKQPGVRLRLDGEPAGTLPLTLRNVTPGEHRLEFVIDNRYSTDRQHVILGRNEVRGVTPVWLRVIRGIATFRVHSEGVTLTLISGEERRVLSDPFRPVEVDTDRPLAVEIAKPGHVLVRQPLTFEDSAEKTFDIDVGPAELAHSGVQEKGRESPVSPAGVHLSLLSKAVGHARPEHAASHESLPKTLVPKAEEPSKAVAQAREGCIINFNSIPASNVGLDGHPLGSTPRMGVSVPAGSHAALFANAEGNRRVPFSCANGSTKTIAVRLAQ